VQLFDWLASRLWEVADNVGLVDAAEASPASAGLAGSAIELSKPLSSYLIVFVGAGIGGALRHGVNVMTLRVLASQFPFHTIFVNIAGSFVMGMLAAWFALKADPGPSWRLFLSTGILGGFTTFSAFSLDTALLYERGEWMLAALYVVGSVALSIAALFAGMMLVRHV
jgi:CrcB protein